MVRRTVEAEPETPSAWSNARVEVSWEEWVRARFARPKIAAVFEAAKQEAGLAPSEVRSGVGWHHPVTRSRGALWFLGGERRWLGGKTPAISGSPVREIFPRRLRHPAPGPERIAAAVTRVLGRQEAARIYHWHAATGSYPPRRPRTDTS